jgi:excisionase family DNA binding protein
MSGETIQSSERIAMSVEDAARLVGVGRSKIFEAIRKDGGLRSVKLGGRRLLLRADLERWLEANAA